MTNTGNNDTRDRAPGAQTGPRRRRAPGEGKVKLSDVPNPFAHGVPNGPQLWAQLQQRFANFDRYACTHDAYYMVVPQPPQFMAPSLNGSVATVTPNIVFPTQNNQPLPTVNTLQAGLANFNGNVGGFGQPQQRVNPPASGYHQSQAVNHGATHGNIGYGLSGTADDDNDDDDEVDFEGDEPMV